jgi:hypothetical protein
MNSDDIDMTDISLSKRYFGRIKRNYEEKVMFYEKDMDIESDEGITYKYNNEGFRCDDFTREKSGLHILFGGCSETEGSSNRLEDVWANVLYNKIKEQNEVSGYYNVGKAGLTVSGVVMNIFQYAYDYGCPDYIFLQLPDQTRYITWSESKGWYPKYQVKDADIHNNINNEHFFKNHESPEIIKVNILFDYLLLRNLIHFCKINNIKLIWSTWHDPTARAISDSVINFGGYVNTSNFNKDYWDIKLNDLRARDGYHFGRGFHKVWAEKFYEEFLDAKNNKKTDS